MNYTCDCCGRKIAGDAPWKEIEGPVVGLPFKVCRECDRKPEKVRRMVGKTEYPGGLPNLESFVSEEVRNIQETL